MKAKNILSKLLILFTGLTFCLCMASCYKPKADLLLYHGIVYTVDQQFSIKEAIAIKDGRILETGTSAELMEKYDYDNRIDLKGKPVYPGFIDAHCHFYGYAKIGRAHV